MSELFLDIAERIEGVLERCRAKDASYFDCIAAIIEAVEIVCELTGLPGEVKRELAMDALVKFVFPLLPWWLKVPVVKGRVVKLAGQLIDWLVAKWHANGVGIFKTKG